MELKMDNERFERELLRLAFETDVTITVATVAYTFGIPSRDARAKLDSLIDSGLLELDSDRDGNLYYKLHQDAGSKVSGRIEEILSSKNYSQYSQEATPSQDEELHTRRASIQETMSYSSSPHADAHQTAEQGHLGGAAAASARGGEHFSSRNYSQYNPGSAASQSGGSYSPISEGRRGWNPSSNDGRVSPGLRGYRPDATLNQCGKSGFVVAEDASCDSRAAGYQSPRSVSCEEPISHAGPAPSSQQDARYPHPYEPYADSRAHVSNVPATYEPSQQDFYEVEDPTHHPAIAVIFSLILPGAGQFYNGQIEKGFFMMLMTFLSWMALFGWAFQIWSIFDALVVASRIRAAQEERKVLEYNKAEETRRALTSNRRF